MHIRKLTQGLSKLNIKNDCIMVKLASIQSSLITHIRDKEQSIIFYGAGHIYKSNIYIERRIAEYCLISLNLNINMPAGYYLFNSAIRNKFLKCIM